MRAAGEGVSGYDQDHTAEKIVVHGASGHVTRRAPGFQTESDIEIILLTKIMEIFWKALKK